MWAYIERSAIFAACWWIFGGLQFGDWFGWRNVAWAIPTGMAFGLFLEPRLSRATLAAVRRRFAKPS